MDIFYFVLPLRLWFTLIPSQLCEITIINMNEQIVHRFCQIKTRSSLLQLSHVHLPYCCRRLMSWVDRSIPQCSAFALSYDGNFENRGNSLLKDFVNLYFCFSLSVALWSVVRAAVKISLYRYSNMQRAGLPSRPARPLACI